MANPISNKQPFSRTMTMALIGIGASAFFGGIIIFAFADLFDPDVQSGANSYSRSAIGHNVAVELLEELEIDVAVSRRDPTLGDAHTAVLVLAEPGLQHLNSDFVTEVENVPTTLLVLPKRVGRADQFNPRWLGTQFVLTPNAVLRTLHMFDPEAELIRPEEEQTWQAHAFPNLVPELDQPQVFRANNVEALIESEAGILLGRIRGPKGTLYILSDADLISNHGLGDGDNAAIFVRLMIHLSREGTITWDETRHGFEISDSVWRVAFEPPLVSVTIATVFAVFMLLLMTTYRFGSPLPAPEVRKRGKSALVLALADLLSMQRHHNELMRRYLVYGLRDTARRMNAPTRMTEMQVIDWIVEIGLSRGMAQTTAELPLRIYDATGNDKLDNAALTRLVKNFYQWKMELLDGSQ